MSSVLEHQDQLYDNILFAKIKVYCVEDSRRMELHRRQAPADAAAAGRESSAKGAVTRVRAGIAETSNR